MPVCMQENAHRVTDMGGAASAYHMEMLPHLLNRAEPQALVQSLAVGRLCCRTGGGLKGGSSSTSQSKNVQWQARALQSWPVALTAVFYSLPLPLLVVLPSPLTEDDDHNMTELLTHSTSACWALF